MAYADSLEQSGDFAASAMAMMERLGIPNTPPNFAIWYNHQSGNLPDLSQKDDILLGNNQRFTDQVNGELYEKFFGFEEDGAVLREASAKVDTAMSEIMAHLEQAGDEAAHFGRALDDFSGQVADGPAMEQISGLLGGIVAETRRMKQQNRSLEDKLTASSDEIAELRQNLESVQTEAMTDALTGLANRKYFDSCLHDSARCAMDSGQPLSLMMVDIDRFKKFNDTYGHVFGDQVLKLVAETLKSRLNGTFVPARYGGEEFSVVMPSTHLLKAVSLGEDLREAIASKKIIRKDTGEFLGKVTMSIGIAQFKFGEPLVELIQRADEALYTAKRGGRNQVISEHTLEAQAMAGAA